MHGVAKTAILYIRCNRALEEQGQRPVSASAEGKSKTEPKQPMFYFGH